MTDELQPKWFYDPNQPPPDPVLVPLAEYDNLRVAVSQLFDAHRALRAVVPLVYAWDVEPEDARQIREDFDHFVREFLPGLTTRQEP